MGEYWMEVSSAGVLHNDVEIVLICERFMIFYDIAMR